MKRLKLNKKQGQFEIGKLLILIPVILVGAAILLFATSHFLNQITSQFRTTDINNSAEARHSMSMAELASNGLDELFLIGFVGLTLGILTFSYFSPMHPILFVPLILIIAITVIVAAPFSNNYDKFANTDDFTTTNENFSTTELIIDNLPLYVLLMGALSMIIMFVRRRSDETF